MDVLPQHSPLTAGAWLKQQRESAQISVEGLCAALKVQPSRLQALESDVWDSLPDALFVRSLALGICRHLRADEQVLLPLLPALPNRDLKVGRNQSESSPYNPNRWSGPMLFFSHRWSPKGSQLVFGAFFLLVLISYFWWQSAIDSKDSSPEVPTSTPKLSEKSAAPPTPLTQESGADQVDLKAVPSESPALPGAAKLTQPQTNSPQGAGGHMVITPVIPMALKQNSDNLAPVHVKP